MYLFKSLLLSNEQSISLQNSFRRKLLNYSIELRNMADQTKMIIITSDEHLIEQFSLHKSKDTQIIDLDDDQSIDTNLDNKALLVTLSKLVRFYIFILISILVDFRNRIMIKSPNVLSILLKTIPPNRTKLQENPVR